MVKRPTLPRWEADPDNPLPTVVRGTVVGVPWYDPGSFALWREAGVEFAVGCSTWEDWFKRYQTTFAIARDQGFLPTKVVVKAADLAAWLERQDLDDNFESRCGYVKWLIVRMA